MVVIVLVLFVWFGASGAWVVGEESGKISLLNCLDKPIPCSAIAVDAEVLYRELGIMPGTPLSAGAISLFKSGNEIVFYSELAPAEKKALLVMPAFEWKNPETMSSAKDRTISNGILTAFLDKRGYTVSFSNGTVLSNVVWNGAVSHDRYASKTGMENVPGLKSLDGMQSRLLAGGGAEAVLETESPVLNDSKLKVVHRLILPVHQPIAEYRVTLTNTGDKMFYLSSSSVNGSYGAIMTGELELQEPAGSGNVDFKDRDFSGAQFSRLPLWTTWAQRPRRWGYIANCAVVSPLSGYAIGFSSLGDYGPIWMNGERWTFGPQMFGLKAITKGNHLPIELAPGKSIEVGNIFYCFTPDNMAFRETVLAFRKVCAGMVPSVNASPAVLAGAVPIKRQFVGDTKLTGLENAILPLKVNPAEKPLLKAECERGGSECKVIALESGKTIVSGVETSVVELLEGAGQRGLNSADKALRKGRFIQGLGLLDLTLKIEGDCKISSLTIAPAPAVAPQLEMPAEGMELTDIASSFKWKSVSGFGKYEVEVADDPEFRNITLSDNVSLGDIDYGFYQCLDVLKSGKHYWRVRAVGGAWSKIGSFTVNSNHEARAPMIVPAKGEPFYTFWHGNPESYCRTYGSNPIPEDLRANSMVITYLVGQSIRTDTVKTAEQKVNVGYRTLCMADMEWAFQNLPNCIGDVDGENMGSLMNMQSDSRTPDRLTRRQFFRKAQLCAKYGRFFVYGDGGFGGYASIGVDREWRALMAKYGRNVLLGFKTNITGYMHAAADANMGLYLSGILPNYYYETENWYWDHAGYRELGTQFGPREGRYDMCPAMFANLQVLAGLARGAGGFKVEHVMLGKGKTEESYELNRILMPFLRSLITHKMVPTKEEVLKNIKAAVVLPDDAVDITLRDSWGPFDALYRATYTLAEHSEHNENWPDNSRYYFIPLLPAGTKSFPGTKVLPLSELKTVEQVKAVFDQLYPPIKGDAFRAVVGDKIFIMPGKENADRIFTYDIPLDGGKITGLEGRIGPMEYLIGKRSNDGNAIWLQSDAAITRYTGTDLSEKLSLSYEFPDSTFSIKCISRPEYEVVPQEALKAEKWQDGKLTLTVSHTERAVEVSVRVNGQ